MEKPVKLSQNSASLSKTKKTVSKPRLNVKAKLKSTQSVVPRKVKSTQSVVPRKAESTLTPKLSTKLNLSKAASLQGVDFADKAKSKIKTTKSKSKIGLASTSLKPRLTSKLAVKVDQSAKLLDKGKKVNTKKTGVKNGVIKTKIKSSKLSKIHDKE